MSTKAVNVTFSEDDFERLQEVKGDRSWKDAILEEFGLE